MKELQEAVFNVMKADSELLTLLGLGVSATESDISKRLIPTTPNRMSEFAIIHFWFPQTFKSSRCALWENRPVQFRIWVKDNSLITQQKIADRLQDLFVDQEIYVEGIGQYSKFFYVGETTIPGHVDEWYGQMLELQFQNAVRNFSKGG